MAKKLKVKLPKRVAGVKIPKVVRKGPVADFLNSTAGQAIIAQALVAAAGAFALKDTDAGTTAKDLLHQSVDGVKRTGRRASRAAHFESSRISFALSEAIEAFRAAMEQGDSEDELRPHGIDVELEPVSKKKHSSQKPPSGTPH